MALLCQSVDNIIIGRSQAPHYNAPGHRPHTRAQPQNDVIHCHPRVRESEVLRSEEHQRLEAKVSLQM